MQVFILVYYYVPTITIISKLSPIKGVLLYWTFFFIGIKYVV